MTPPESTWPTDGRLAADLAEATGRRASAAFQSSEWWVVLLVAGLLAYLPALWGVFAFDDYSWILHNPRLEALDFWQRRPLTLLTFAANLRFTTSHPVGFHVVNIALHLANCALVYVVIGRTLPRGGASPAAAAAGAAMFLLHPAQTGAVTYVSGRATALMTFWLLLGHLAALRGLEGNSRRRVALSLGAFALAVASKETALAYPAMWIGWLVFGKGLALGRSLRLATPHLLASLILLVAMILHPGYRSFLGEAAATGRLAATRAGQVEQRLGLGFCFNDDQPRMDSCTARRVEGVAGLARYLVSPWRITIDPGRRAADAADLLMVALVGLAAWAALRTRPSAVAAGAAWIIAALLPTNLVLVRSDPVSDRLLYLPMVGIALVAAAVAGRIATRAVRPVAAVCVCSALLALAVLTWQRNQQYSSETALWEDAVAKNAGNARARYNLGFAYESQGDLDAAESQYRAALRLRPQLPWAAQGLRRVELEREGEEQP